MLVRVTDNHAQDRGQGNQKEEQGDIEDLLIDFLVPQHPLSEADLEDGGGIQGLDNLHPDGLEQDEHAVGLETAGRGPGAAAHETAEDQDEARQHGPVGIVTDGQSRRGGIAG